MKIITLKSVVDLFLVALGLLSCMWAFSSCEWGLLFTGVQGFLIICIIVSSLSNGPRIYLLIFTLLCNPFLLSSSLKTGRVPQRDRMPFLRWCYKSVASIWGVLYLKPPAPKERSYCVISHFSVKPTWQGTGQKRASEKSWGLPRVTWVSSQGDLPLVKPW